MRAIILCVVLLLCGCAVSPIHTFVPGEQPPIAVRMPKGTKIETLDGKIYVLGCDGVVLSEGHWYWVIAALDYAMKRHSTVDPETYRF